MSARASAYMKSLVVCPSGDRITRSEKAVGMVLADSHQDRSDTFTYPSVETIAEESICSRRVCQRLLGALERKGVIFRMRPRNQGRGTRVFYFFRQLDSIPKGWHDVALSDGPFLYEKGDGRATEGRQKGDTAGTSSTNRNKYNKSNKDNYTPLPPSPGGERLKTESTFGGSTNGDAVNHPALASALLPFKESANGNAVNDPALASAFQSAVDQVMHGCAFTRRRLRGIVEAQLRQQHDNGKSIQETVLAMIEAWKNQQSQDLLLKAKYGADKFFGDGIWRDERGWNWDKAAIEDHMRKKFG